jgi:hypothetical protein
VADLFAPYPDYDDIPVRQLVKLVWNQREPLSRRASAVASLGRRSATDPASSRCFMIVRSVGGDSGSGITADNVGDHRRRRPDAGPGVCCVLGRSGVGPHVWLRSVKEP